MVPLIAGLLKLGLPLLANAFAAKGADWVKEKTGVDLESALGTEEGRLKLRQAELEHEQELLELRYKQDALGVELEKVLAQDRGSAREREIALAREPAAPLIGKITTPLLAIGTVVGFFTVLGTLIYVSATGLQLAEGVKEVLFILLGALTNQTAAVYQYYFGSSSGSAQKNVLLERATR